MGAGPLAAAAVGVQPRARAPDPTRLARRADSSRFPLARRSRRLGRAPHLRDRRVRAADHAGVEGAEYEVIEGMPNCIRRHHPDLIVEMSDQYLHAFGRTEEQLRGRLLDEGYRAYLIDHDGLMPVGANADGLPPQYNALFTVR